MGTVDSSMYRKYTVQLTECGIFSNGKLNAKSLVQAVAMHHVVLSCKAELDQLIDGLNALGMHKHLVNHSDILSHLFVIGNAKIPTAGMFYFSLANCLY